MADWDVSSEAPAPAPAPDPNAPPVQDASTPAAVPAPQVPAAAVAAPAASADPWSVSGEAPAPPDKQTIGGAVQAAGVGVSNFAVDTAGLPVSTERNVEELGKAAGGIVASSLYTDKVAPGETLDKSGNFAKTPGGLYHWRTVDGNDIYSKNPPPKDMFTYPPVIRGGGATIPKWLQPEDPDKYKYDIGSPEFLKSQLETTSGLTNLFTVSQKTKVNRYIAAGVEGALSATVGSEGSAIPKALAVGTAAGTVGQQLEDAGAGPGLSQAAALLAGVAVHHSIKSPVAAPAPEIPKATIDPAERILSTPALPGPSPAEVDNKPAAAAPGKVPDPNTPAAPVAAQEATQAGASPTTNNASGESSASAEAISRVEQERNAGQTRHVIDEDGRASPLVGVDAADAVARPGTIIVQKGVGAKPVTVLDRGGLSAAQAQGLVARSQAMGHLADEAPAGTPEPSEAPEGHIGVVEHEPATEPADYVDPGSTHPMRNGQPYAIIRAEKPDQTPQENAQRTQLLGQILQASGMRSAPMHGSQGGVPEHSYAVQTATPGAQGFVNQVSQQFKQDSVMHVDANQNATLHYADGRREWLGGMKQVPAADAQNLPGWTRDTQGNFYAVKAPGSEPGTRTAASASQSIFGDPAKTGSAKDVGKPEQARRAATFKRIGLDEVRGSALTGNAKEASSDFQTAKLDTPGGVRMTQVQDAERGALMAHADKLVSDSGGSKGLSQPDLESRGRKMASPIDGYDQALEQATQRIYDIAKTVAAGKPTTLGGLAHVMTKQKSQFLGTVEGKQLLEGVQARMQELGFMGDNDTFNPATIEQAERLRQYIGQQWSPRVTQLVAMLKNHLDNDVAATAGADIFKQGREIRALRSKVLEEPEGVARLIQPKEANKLGINRITDFSDIPHMITQLEPDQFGHYVDTLRVISNASPDLHSKAVAALREVRSQFANEYAAEGNKTAGAWNHKAANQYLKKNEANMRKVFTSEELGEYQDNDNAGRWLHQDKSYPGAAAQKENFLASGVLKGGGKLAEGIGAVAGHVPGYFIGKGVDTAASKLADKITSGTVEGRIKALSGEPEEPEPEPSGPTPGQKIGGGKQRGGPAYNPYDKGVTPKPKASTGQGDPYNTAPMRPDVWANERFKNERGGLKSTLGQIIGGGKQRGGPKFVNNSGDAARSNGPGSNKGEKIQYLRDELAATPESDPDHAGLIDELKSLGYKGPEMARAQLKEWFSTSKVTDAKGEPQVVYHGSNRIDRLAGGIKANRASSGPMPFFTDDPEIASSYAKGKQDTSLSGDDMDYRNWFKFKPEGGRAMVPLDRKWYGLSPEQQATFNDKMHDIRQNEDSGKIETGEKGGGISPSTYDYELKRAQGNGIEAAKELWLSSGALFNQEHKFIDVMKQAGIDMKGVDYNDHNGNPGTLPVYLRIQNPLDTSKLMEKDGDAFKPSALGQKLLDAVGKMQWRRKSGAQVSGDIWDKGNVDKAAFVQRLQDDLAKGTTHTWTSIPDKVTELLRGMGYDGIKDTGGKNGGNEHTVWVPFHPSQVYSAIGTPRPSAPKPVDPRLTRDQQIMETSPLKEGDKITPPGMNKEVAVERVGTGYNIEGKLVPFVWYTDSADGKFKYIEASKAKSKA